MKVICTLPNASSLINGVQFVEHKLGKISEEIADDVGEAFLKIEGYIKYLAGSKSDATASTASTASTTAPKAAAPGASSTAATPAAPAAK